VTGVLPLPFLALFTLLGAPIGWSPVEEAVRVLETRQTYEFKAGVPKLRKTSVEDWTKGKGKRVKVTRAPAE